MKNMLFCPQFCPRMLKIAFEGFEFLKIFWGSIPPDPLPPRKRGLTALVDTVSYPIQNCWLLQFLLNLVCCAQISVFKDFKLSLLSVYYALGLLLYGHKGSGFLHEIAYLI